MSDIPVYCTYVCAYVMWIQLPCINVLWRGVVGVYIDSRAFIHCVYTSNLSIIQTGDRNSNCLPGCAVCCAKLRIIQSVNHDWANISKQYKIWMSCRQCDDIYNKHKYLLFSGGELYYSWKVMTHNKVYGIFMTWNLSLEFCDNSDQTQVYFVNNLLQTGSQLPHITIVLNILKNSAKMHLMPKLAFVSS